MLFFKTTLTLALIFEIDFILSVNVQNRNDQFRVYSKIYNDSRYNKNIRPDESVDFTASFSLKQIVSIDEKNQIMTSNSYLGLSWLDQRLKWNPEDYNDVKYILIPTSQLWIVDLFVINTAETNGFITIPTQSLASVSSNGYVYVVFSLTSLKTRCQLNVKYFPFDTQNCSVTITISIKISLKLKNNVIFLKDPIWKLDA